MTEESVLDNRKLSSRFRANYQNVWINTKVFAEDALSFASRTNDWLATKIPITDIRVEKKEMNMGCEKGD